MTKLFESLSQSVFGAEPQSVGVKFGILSSALGAVMLLLAAIFG